MGFLHAVPEGKETSRWQDHVTSHKCPPPLPEIEAGDYLLDDLLVFGPHCRNGEGQIVAKDWSELWAFHRSTGRVPEHWEREILHSMCRAYVDGLKVGLSPLGIPPYDVKNKRPS